MNCLFTYNHVCLQGLGYVLPPHKVTSAAIEARLASVYQRLKLPAGRLELMTGIRSRRFWDAGTRPSQGAVQAGRRALAAADAEPAEIGCLVFASVSRDMMEPATAAFVHRALDLSPECQIFDLSNACLGFLNGMVMVANMIELGQIRTGMVVASETAEELLESTIAHLRHDPDLTRKSIKPAFASLTIGSGAVALVLGDRRLGDSGHVLHGGTARANTAQNHLCQGGQNGEQGVLMSTDSETLLEQGVATAAACWQAFIREMDWPPASVRRFFCHQVGRAHARLLFDRLGLDPALNFETLAELGNVGSVSAPISLALGIDQGCLRSGERAALLGIGSGINALMLAITW